MVDVFVHDGPDGKKVLSIRPPPPTPEEQFFFHITEECAWPDITRVGDLHWAAALEQMVLALDLRDRARIWLERAASQRSRWLDDLVYPRVWYEAWMDPAGNVPCLRRLPR